MILFDHDKAIHLMQRDGLDLLLPNSILNAGYLSDHWKHDLYGSTAAYRTFDKGELYQLFVGLPRDRHIEPFITCRRASEEGDMYNWDVWIQDRRVWGPSVLPKSANSLLPPMNVLYPDPYAAIEAALGERKLLDSTIGVEMPFLSVDAFANLRRVLPDATFRDATQLFLELRLIKSDEEIRRMCAAARASQSSLEVAIPSIAPGTTGFDLERIVGAEHYRHGARLEWMHTQMGPFGLDVVGPNARPARAGEVIRVDVGGSHRSYQSDVSPMIAVGEPSARVLKTHQTMRRAMDAVLEALRPGVPTAEVFAIGNAIFAEEHHRNYVEYLGHGIGRDVHEGPLIAPESSDVLVKGMTFAIEVVTTIPDIGMIGLEDDVVITANGHEDLTTIGRELHVVSA